MTAIAHRSWFGDGWRHGARRVARPAVVHVAGCVLAFGAVLAGGIHLTDNADWSGLAHGRAALDAAKARAAAAERVLAGAAGRVPEAAADDAIGDRAPGWPALMLELAELAASSGLRVVALEPQPEQDAKAPDARRTTVRVVAQGGFPALRRMVSGLAALPVLVVPAAMRVERDAAVSRMQLSLDVFPGLPGGEAAHGDGQSANASLDADPFGGPDGPGTGDASLSRLAGVMRDARGGLALFDDGAGAILAVAAGESVGAVRVLRVEPDAVTLATASGPRRIEMDDREAQW